MPSKTTIDRARQDKREGKSPTTQAGEFVREEMDHIREGKHGARSTKQAIAIGLSKARHAGVDLPPPKKGRVSERTRRSAELAYEEGQGKRKPRSPSRRRSRAAENALKREGHSAASHAALSRHAKTAAAARRRRGGVTEGVGRPASATGTRGTRRARSTSSGQSSGRKRASTTRARRSTSKRAQRASSARKTSARTQRRRRTATTTQR
jgi:hypothetical protein